MYRQRPIYPANYYPQYSRDPRYQGDPRYYGGSPSFKSPYGPPPPPRGVGSTPIIACAFVLVVLIVAAIIGLGLGLGFGLSGNSSTNVNTNIGSVSTQTPVVPGVTVDPNAFVTVDTTLDTTVAYNSDFADPSSPAFQGLGALVIPSIDRSFQGSNVSPIYAGSQLISAAEDTMYMLVSDITNTVVNIYISEIILKRLNGNARIVARTFLRAASPLDVTDTSSALQSAEASVQSILLADSLDGNIGDLQSSVGVVPNAVQSTQSGITSISPTSTESLSAVCPLDIRRFADSGQNSASVTWNAPAVSGSDGPITFTYSPNIGSSFSIGTTTVVATVTDSRASFQCDFDVTILANSDSLSIICPPNIVQNTNAGESYATVQFGNAQVSGGQGLVDVSYNPSPSNQFPVGGTVVTVTAQDTTNVATCSFQVTVQDNEGPTLTCPSSRTVDTDQGRNYATITWQSPTVTDNVDSILAVSTSRNPGQYLLGRYVIEATATDNSGNRATCTWIYDVVDNENPIVVCPSSFTVRLPSTLTSIDISFDTRISASDNVPAGLTIQVQPSDLRPFEAGTYETTATATDSSGNTATCTFTLTVSASCGKGAMTLQPRIIGGADAEAGQYPWMASLTGASHFCGSVIMNENWLISAAHCFDDGLGIAGVTAIAGDVSLMSATANRQTRSLSQLIVHPSYVTFPNHDIVLLRLNEALTFTDYVTPACLTEETEETGLYETASCYVAGWGTTSTQTQDASDILQDVRVNVYNTETCIEDFFSSPADASNRPTSNTICAGFPQGGADACVGDSGGALVCPDATYQWHVVGIVSSGVGCANPGSPGFYTRVSQYLDFIYAYIGTELVFVEPGSPRTLVSPREDASSANYPNDAVKGWRFRRFGATFLRLTFTQFDLAVGDTLTLGRGLDPADSNSIIQTMGSDFTGTNQDLSETDIWFRFVSNGQTTATGFTIGVSAVN